MNPNPNTVNPYDEYLLTLWEEKVFLSPCVFFVLFFFFTVLFCLFHSHLQGQHDRLQHACIQKVVNKTFTSSAKSTRRWCRRRIIHETSTSLSATNPQDVYVIDNTATEDVSSLTHDTTRPRSTHSDDLNDHQLRARMSRWKWHSSHDLITWPQMTSGRDLKPDLCEVSKSVRWGNHRACFLYVDT